MYELHLNHFSDDVLDGLLRQMLDFLFCQTLCDITLPFELLKFYYLVMYDN